jgi:excinuclease ABC subunit C
MECFDISHTMGEQTVASCVVFDANGPLRAEYRRYNITGITPGDDYAAMNQVLRRRYGKAIEESKIPDVILIDGGKGQLGQAKAVFESLDVSWDKTIRCCWAWRKGPIVRPVWRHCSSSRKVRASACRRTLRRCTSSSIFAMNRTIMPSAVTAKTGEGEKHQYLETIEGVGPKRRQMLLKYMGGLQGLLNASMEEIAKVPGISQGLAEKIYYSLKH